MPPTQQAILKQAEDRLLRELEERQALLFAHYGVEDMDVTKLCARLMREFVPGFQVVADIRPKRGPKTKWDDKTYTALLAAVEAVKSERTCSDAEACKIIASSPKYKNAPWNAKGQRKVTARSLQTRLSEARNANYNATARLVVDQADARAQKLLREALERALKAGGPSQN